MEDIKIFHYQQEKKDTELLRQTVPKDWKLTSPLFGFPSFHDIPTLPRDSSKASNPCRHRTVSPAPPTLAYFNKAWPDAYHTTPPSNSIPSKCFSDQTAHNHPFPLCWPTRPQPLKICGPLPCFNHQTTPLRVANQSPISIVPPYKIPLRYSSTRKWFWSPSRSKRSPDRLQDEKPKRQLWVPTTLPKLYQYHVYDLSDPVKWASHPVPRGNGSGWVP